MEVGRPVYDDVERAVAEFDPDLLFLHWATHAAQQLPLLERLGLPFGLRVHSFDHDPETIARLRDHPLCLGVWTYPGERQVPGTHGLVPIFGSVDRMPSAPVRDTIVSVSAGLPKKDWDLLLDAFGRLPGVRRRIVIGMTAGHEDLAGHLAGEFVAMPDPPLLQVNLERDEVFALLARAAALVYTLSPGADFYMPMSIVEAMASGASVIAPDRPEAREYVGKGFRGYRDAGDIERHARAVLAGGHDVALEREANRTRALKRFCAPEARRVLRLGGARRVGPAAEPNDRDAPLAARRFD